MKVAANKPRRNGTVRCAIYTRKSSSARYLPLRLAPRSNGAGQGASGRRLALPSGEFRQYINASQRYLGLLDFSTTSLGLSRLRRRCPCRIPPETAAVSRRSPTVIKTGVNTRIGWLSDQD